MRIEIFELLESSFPQSCRTGEDQTQTTMEEVFRSLQMAGIEVQRYRLDADPLSFAAHVGVSELLDADGVNALPAIFIDGKLAGSGQKIPWVELKKTFAVRGVQV